MKKLIFVTVLILLGNFTTRAQDPTPSNDCDPSLWNYVYTPSRFGKTRPVHRCVTVKGRITKVWPRGKESDGDIHLSINPDNMSLPKGQTSLVVEIICAERPTKGAAIDSCARFHRDGKGHPLALGRTRLNSLVGKHVIITGELVIDYGHPTKYGYHIRELHPVTKINRIN
ncbi:MAG TPA: hypothetical protein VF553_01270 [Pyrinomonadaceae bacterium]